MVVSLGVSSSLLLGGTKFAVTCAEMKPEALAVITVEPCFPVGLTVVVPLSFPDVILNDVGLTVPTVVSLLLMVTAAVTPSATF